MKKPALIASVLGKGAIALALCIGIATATLGLLLHGSADRLAHESMAQRAELVTALLADLGAAPLAEGRGAALETLFKEAGARAHDAKDAVIAVDAKGQPMASWGKRVAEDAALKTLAAQAVSSGATRWLGAGLGVAIPVRAQPKGAVIGAIATRWNPDATDALLHEMLAWDVMVSGLVFLLAFATGIAGFYLMLVRPLSGLSLAIRGVAGKQFDVAIPGLSRRDEVGEIAHALEDLRAQLAAGEEAAIEARYKQAAFEGSSAAMMLVDQDMRVRHLNPAMTALLHKVAPEIRKRVSGFDPDNLIGETINRFHQDNRPVHDALARSREGRVGVEMTLGEVRLELTVSAFRSASGAVLGSVLEWQDVTDEALNAAVLGAINDEQCRAEFDATGALISCNDRFAQALGQQGAALLGRIIEDLVSPEWSAREGWEGMFDRIAEGGAGPTRFALRGAEGAQVLFDGGIVCVRDRAGGVMRFLMLGRDVTADAARLAVAEAEGQRLIALQGQVVDTLRLGLRRLREGDLSLRIEEEFPADYTELKRDYNAMIDTLAEALGEIADNASNIFGEARDISSTADALSRRTESTAATLEETAAALDQLTKSVRSAAERAAEADGEVGDARTKAERGGEVVLETVEAMDQISTSSDKITSITNVIEDIAFQTNLLALNAGVEAARAGEAGRGFAVVASEVRALAQRCSEAAREINELIAESGTHVKHGVALVGQTGDSLREIVGSIGGIATLVTEIASSARQQSAGLAEINAAVNDLDQSTQQNAARLEETTAASQSLTNDAMSMVEAVSHFKLGKEKRSVPDEVLVSFSSRRDAGPEVAPAEAADQPGSASTPAPAAAPRRAAVGAQAVPTVPEEGDGWSEY